MKYALGIDGGGTKTSFMLADESGNIMSGVDKSGLDFTIIGEEGVREIVIGGMLEVCGDAGITPSQIRSVTAGVPCFGEYPEWDKKCKEMFTNIFEGAEVSVENDVVVGMYGSLALEAGVHIVSGTGAITFGCNEQGETARSGGWSEHFSDEGSCYWLGMKTIQLFTKQSDYRIKRSHLYDVVKEELKLEDDFDIISHYNEYLAGSREKTAKLQLLLKQAALKGDESAIDLYREAAKELALCAKAVYNRLGFNERVRLSYSGGVFKNEELIMAPLRKYLQELDVEIVSPILSPIQGAVLHAVSKVSSMEKKIIINHIEKG